MKTWCATAIRLLQQLRNDPRTIALILVIPSGLMTLLYFVFSRMPQTVFDRIGPIMLAILPMTMMFLVSSVVMLQERTLRTLERILTTPLRRWNLIFSYATVFSLLAVVQALILVTLILGVFEVKIQGSVLVLVGVAILDAVFGVAFGLLASAYAKTEFQAVQFMPMFVAPQMFLCGLLVPTDSLPAILEIVARWIPMTWAVDVIVECENSTVVSHGSLLRLCGLVLVTIVVLVLSSTTMRRATK